MKKFLRSLITYIAVFSMFLTVATVQPESAAFGASKPKITGETAMIYCATTGEEVWRQKAGRHMNPASMTKLMTCLLAAENLDLDKEVEVTAEATYVIPSKMYLAAGEKIKVRDLLYAALLESANDAAAALAIEVAGSVKDFAVMMNNRAVSLGCKDTNFENPHGLAANNQYSSARDIALIATEAFKNKTIKKIAATLEYTIEATNKAGKRELENGNLFLNGGEQETPNGIVSVKKYKGVFGGKTGTSETQESAMVVGLDYDGMEIYAVIMGTTMKERFNDIKKLLNYGKENVAKYVVFEKATPFEKGKVTGGATNRVVGLAADPGYINLPEGASASLVTTKAIYDEELTAPIKKGQKVGIVEIYLADEKVREVDMLAEEAIEKGWILSKWGITNFQTIIICIVAALLILSIAAIFIIRAVNRNRKKRLRKQRILELAQKELEREQDMRQRNWPY